MQPFNNSSYYCEVAIATEMILCVPIYMQYFKFLDIVEKNLQRHPGSALCIYMCIKVKNMQVSRSPRYELN